MATEKKKPSSKPQPQHKKVKPPKLIKLNIKHLPSPFGIPNGGNTCYFAALTQCLISCPAFVEAIQSMKKTIKNNQVLDLLYNISISKSPVPGSTLVKVMRHQLKALGYTRQFPIPGRQEDALESMTALLECLPYPVISSLFMTKYAQTHFCYDCSKRLGKAMKYNTYVTNPGVYIFPELRTVIGERMMFNGKKEIDKKAKSVAQHFIKITPPEKGTFNDHVRKRLSVMTDKYCQFCKKKTYSYLVEGITVVPTIMIVSTLSYNKKHKVNWGKSLEIPHQGGKNMIRFKPVGIINHSGGHNGGHYTARGLRKDGKWYEFNDSSYSATSPSFSSSTYVVAYHFTEIS